MTKKISVNEVACARKSVSANHSADNSYLGWSESNKQGEIEVVQSRSIQIEETSNGAVAAVAVNSGVLATGVFATLYEWGSKYLGYKTTRAGYIACAGLGTTLGAAVYVTCKK